MVTIPTLSQLYTNIKSDIEAEFGDSIPTFGKVALRVFAAVQAAKLKIMYLALGNIQKNIFVDSADPEAKGGTLERFGRVKLNRNPFSPTAGQYTLQVTGTIGYIIAAGTAFRSNDNSVNPGKTFILDVAYELTATTDYITVRALESGIDSRMNIGEGMTSTVPIIGVDRAGTVTAEVVEALDGEDIEDYRQEIINSFTLEPQGGAASDYKLWASDVQGVKQVYPYPKSGAPNEINLYIEAKTVDSIDGKGTPSATMLSDVEAVIDFDPDTTKPLNERGRRPLTVLEVHYLPITPLNVDIVINDFNDVTAEQEAAVENALTLFIANIRPFVAGTDILANKNDVIDKNRIISVILNLYPGSTFGEIDLSVNSIPLTTYTFENGDIPFVNSITFYN